MTSLFAVPHVLLLFLLGFLVAPSIAAEESLFHLRFDGSLEASPAGVPAPKTEKSIRLAAEGGKEGGALDLTETEYPGGYITLTYEVAGNLSLEEGTVEFWYRPEFTRPSNSDASFTSYYLFDLPLRELGGKGEVIRVGLKLSENLGEQKLWLETGLAEGQGKSVVPVVVHWNAGEWHHIALTWNAVEVTLYSDGIPVGTVLSKGGLFGSDDRRAGIKGVFGVGGIMGFSHQFNAGGFIDEFRIAPRAYSEGEIQEALLRYP